MQIKQLLRFALLLGATFSLLSTVRAEDWPQFRGPNASGVASQTYALPTEFSFTDKVKWSATLGDGIGSPIVVEGRVFITAMVGEQKFGVFCFDAATGKVHWQREFPIGKLPRITPPN